MDIKQALLNCTSEYLKDELHYGNLLLATNKYKAILNQLCGEEMDVDAGRADLEFSNGKALGTYWAAMCLDDLLRTRQFIRGIDAAIKDKLKTQDQLHILYAGTGPFATLILPLLLRNHKQNIHYTLVEVNPLSFKMLQNVISKLALEDYNITLVQADATTYKIDSQQAPDIIISETMQNALAKEQQVSIFLNLMKQVKPETLFIPEKIELFLGLLPKGISESEVTPNHYHKAKKIFELSTEAVFSELQNKAQQLGETVFQKTQTVLNKDILEKYNILFLLTEIQVYKDTKINITESGLTTPLRLMDISNTTESLTIDTQYEISAEPKLEYKITTA